MLPLLPGLAASSPLVEGRPTGLADNRLEFYRHNQRRLPELAGRIVPEPVYTRADYEREILAAQLPRHRAARTRTICCSTSG